MDASLQLNPTGKSVIIKNKNKKREKLLIMLFYVVGKTRVGVDDSIQRWVGV